ncbi:MAG: ATP-binding protein [Minisyncoccia bacterium]
MKKNTTENNSTEKSHAVSEIGSDISLLDNAGTLAATTFEVLTKYSLVSITDSTGKFQYVNDFFCKVSQYKREELIGQHSRILKSDHHSASFYENMWKTIQRGDMWRGEIKNKTKNGSTYWADFSIAPILDKDGKIVNYIAVSFLITEKKVIEEQLNEKAIALESVITQMKERETELENIKKATLNILDDLEEEKNAVERRVVERTEEIVHEKEKLHQVTKNMNDGAILLDTKGDVIFVNERVYELIGIKNEDRQPLLSLDFLFNYFKSADLKKYFKKCIDGETFHIHEVEVDKKIYELFFHCLEYTQTSNQSDGCFILISDITDRKLLERSKSELVAIASHQLRTPLTAMRGNVEMLIDESYGAMNKGQHELLEDIEISTKRLITMVNDMLDITKIEQGKLDMICEPVNIKDLIDSICIDLADYAKRHLFTIETLIPENIVAHGDKLRMRQVFQNLIDNAIKYSRNPGKLSIIVRIDRTYVEIMLKDNGIGIPKNEQSKLFDRFYRASNTANTATSGSGLGLYIVQSIVGQLGGTIRFESEENVGTTFFVNLPKNEITIKK